MILKFELDLDFLTVHLLTMFHHPMFNYSEVIMLTNKHTKKEILLNTSTSLQYAMPVKR